ncbi:MAG: hypothetical protein P9M14_03390 [Candidatus Alcyoniella australis]|nr:hypothetical protein [Candidatus Alcyoniella australis]
MTMRTVAIIAVLLSALTFAAVAAAQPMPTGNTLVIYGWSDDDKLWAFGERGDYSGGALAGESIHVYVIDALKNDFVKKLEGEFTERDYPDMERAANDAARFDQRTHTQLGALGIRGRKGNEVYRQPIAVWLGYDSVIKQFGENLVRFSLGDQHYEIKLEQSVEQNAENPWDAKSKFSLSIRRNSGPWQVLQADRSAWRKFIQYKIVYVSISPGGDKIAVVIEAVQLGFEAAKIPRYKGITGALPR